MDAINYDAELRRAGANATQGWRRLGFVALHHALGTAGLIIMAVGFIGLLLSFVMWDSWMGAGYFSRPPDERTLRQDPRR